MKPQILLVVPILQLLVICQTTTMIFFYLKCFALIVFINPNYFVYHVYVL